MLKRKVIISSEIKYGGMLGEIQKKDGHTYVNQIKLNLHIFQLANHIGRIPIPLVRCVRMDDTELNAFLVFNIRDRKVFYHALDCLSETERNEILMEYHKRENKNECVD